MTQTSIRVVAAVIQDDGKYLITQRRENASLPLLWEFPGGRVEPGETDAAALQREYDSLQPVFDAAQVGFLLVNDRNQVVRVNEMLANIVGRNAADMLGHQPGDGLCCLNAVLSPAGCGSGEACSETSSWPPSNERSRQKKDRRGRFPVLQTPGRSVRSNAAKRSVKSQLG